MSNTQNAVSQQIKLGNTTSLVVAEKFGKRHDDVLRSIKNLIDYLPHDQDFFQPSSYLNKQNKKQPMYEMGRKGFQLLAMGFSGEAAIKWKINYLIHHAM